MAIGKSRATSRVNGNGEKYIYRTPAKKLKLSDKEKLTAILKRNDIDIEIQKRNGAEEYIVKDSTQKQLFSCLNSWGSGYFAVNMDGKLLAETDWFEADNNTNDDQQDIFDIIDNTYKKHKNMRIQKEQLKVVTPVQVFNQTQHINQK